VDVYAELAKELKALNKSWEQISALRPRPYSRLVALIDADEMKTLADYCKGEGEHEEVAYVRKIGACKSDNVKIYRGVGEESKVKEIEPGDWVALDYRLAEWYARDPYTNLKTGEVLSKEVPAIDVRWAGTDQEEWYYVPHELVGRFASVEQFRREFGLIDHEEPAI